MSAPACNILANAAAMAPRRPLLQTAVPPNSGRYYRRVYALQGDRGTCLLQRVGVHIRYRCGSRVLVDYRTSYCEFFTFERDGTTVLDLHDFDAVRDGWRQAAIDALLRRHAPHAAHKYKGASDEPQLEVVKTFALGFGTVEGAQSQPVADGVTFGFVAFGATPAAPARLRLSIDENLPPIDVPGRSPCPPGTTITGSGAFTSDCGWRAVEHFRYRFACLVGSLRDREGYRASTLPTNRFCST
jgi:hypothetical protein